MHRGVEKEQRGSGGGLPMEPPFNINTFQTHHFKGTRSSCACFSTLSSALKALIALLMRRHRGDIWCLPAHPKIKKQNKIHARNAAPLPFVLVCFNVDVCVLKLKGNFN